MTEQASRTISSPRRKLLRLDSFWAWAVGAALLCGATVAVSLVVLPSIKPAFLLNGNAEFYRLVDAGNAAQNKGDHSAAVEYYTKALSHRAPTVLLESIALRLRAESLGELGRRSEAIQDSDRAVARTPNDPLAYFGRADVLLGLKRYAAALQDYDRYLARVPNSESGYIGKGVALRGLGKLVEAREAYDEALRIAPNSPGAYYRRANVLNALGQYAAAAADYSQAIEIRPTADAFYGRGLSKRNLNDNEGALVDYGRAIELDSKHVAAHTNRGNVFRELKKYEQALADYDAALRADPSHVNAYRNRGWLHEQRGQLDPARADYEEGLKLAPNDAWLRGAMVRLESSMHK